ncbi:MAG: glycine cleavage system protein GcvH [Spirochaetales bacterium]|nr:glycine cleavage system protein GcvH [Spirochaetales bacterium]
MNKVPENLLYTSKHEWALEEGGLLLVGITDYAQHSLGDIVYIDVKPVGTVLAREGSFGAIESVKAAEELYAPLGGSIAQVNPALNQDPARVNQDPYGSWIIKIKDYSAGDLGTLMNSSAYADYIKTLG